MKMLRILLLMASFVGLAGGCASTSESYVRSGYDFSSIDQVAIINVVGAVNSPGAQKQIEDAFTANFLDKGYAPVVKEYVERRLSQTDFDGRDLSPEVYAIEAGRVLGVPAVLVINVPSFGDTISMTGKLIEVDQGSVLWISQASEKYSEGGGWKSWFAPREKNDYDREFENAMMQYSVQTGAQPYEQQKTEMSDMGSGATLTPQEERVVYDLVGRICESLPDKMMGSLMTSDYGEFPQKFNSGMSQPKPRRSRSFTWRDLID